jgi:hypothetical protein
MDAEADGDGTDDNGRGGVVWARVVKLGGVGRRRHDDQEAQEAGMAAVAVRCAAAASASMW